MSFREHGFGTRDNNSRAVFITQRGNSPSLKQLPVSADAFRRVQISCTPAGFSIEHLYAKTVVHFSLLLLQRGNPAKFIFHLPADLRCSAIVVCFPSTRCGHVILDSISPDAAAI